MKKYEKVKPAHQQQPKEASRRWNQTEILVVKTLFHHYAEDYAYISEQMCKTFTPKIFQPYTCRIMIFQQGPQNVINRSPLSPREINFIHKNFKQHIKMGSKKSWQDITLNFPHRDISFLKHQYYLLLGQISRSLCYFYFPDRQTKYYYATRMQRISLKTWLLILYLSQMELPQVYQNNKMIIKVWEASKSLEKYISIFIQYEQYGVTEDTNFPKLKGVDELPNLKSCELMDIIEPILTCDSSTLIRVCSSMAPYEIDGLNALKRSCITTCDDETTPIPERRIYKAREYLTNINSHNQMIRDDYKKYYLPLTENQIEVLINSDVMNFVLPITTLLDQRTGKQPRIFMND